MEPAVIGSLLKNFKQLLILKEFPVLAKLCARMSGRNLPLKLFNTKH